jgi:ribonuclease III
MDPHENLLEKIDLVEQRISYVFKDKSLLVLAFVHRSFHNEHRDKVPEHNERLEFLGDSVLSIIISKYLYSTFPNLSEGNLSHMRGYLVEASMCAKLLKKLDLSEFIVLGKGELMSEGRNKESIQADFFEALLGALFLDGGLDSAKAFFWHNFTGEIEERVKKPVRNWKAELQDYSQKKHQKTPVYQVLNAHGPDHNKEFEVAVYIEDKKVGTGIGSSKKEAEQEAARTGLQLLEKGKKSNG